MGGCSSRVVGLLLTHKFRISGKSWQNLQPSAFFCKALKGGEGVGRFLGGGQQEKGCR